MPLKPRSSTIGALIIRIGIFGVHYTILAIRTPPHPTKNSVGNYLGPY